MSGVEKDVDRQENAHRRISMTGLDAARGQRALTREVSYQDVVEQVESRQSESDPNQRIIITFHSTDIENPDNWRWQKKWFVVFVGLINTMNSTLGSSLPSNCISYIAAEFHIDNEEQLVLPISIFLVGYVFGPLVCSPLSEQYGRRPVLLIAFTLFTIFTMACALAPTYPSFLIFRFFCGANASAPIAMVGGLYADVYHNARKRGYAMAVFVASTTFGPCLAPMMSGFSASHLGWRWTFWIALIFAGLTLPVSLFLPESYAPVLLHKKAKALRKTTGNMNILSRAELEPQTAQYIVTKVLTRPIRMLIQESIVMFTCMYLALAYGIYYMFFQAYPLIYQGPDSVYKFNPGLSGLAFLPIAVGAVLCAGLFFVWDGYLHRSIALQRPWTRREEMHRLPLACFGGPLIVISLLWLGWTSRSSVPWIVPMLSGVLFGLGFLLVFMAMFNYLTDAYETFAASAQGISSTTRSIFGALLPLAAKRMYTTLGIEWASSLLAFVSLGVAGIPFVFILYGERIREGSKFCAELKRLKDKEARDEEEENERRRSRARSGAEGAGMMEEKKKGMALGDVEKGNGGGVHSS